MQLWILSLSGKKQPCASLSTEAKPSIQNISGDSSPERTHRSNVPQGSLLFGFLYTFYPGSMSSMGIM